MSHLLRSAHPDPVLSVLHRIGRRDAARRDRHRRAALMLDDASVFEAQSASFTCGSCRDIYVRYIIDW